MSQGPRFLLVWIIRGAVLIVIGVVVWVIVAPLYFRSVSNALSSLPGTLIGIGVLWLVFGGAKALFSVPRTPQTTGRPTAVAEERTTPSPDLSATGTLATRLRIAVRLEETATVRELLTAHPELAAVNDEGGNSPLQIARDDGNPEIVALLEVALASGGSAKGEATACRPATLLAQQANSGAAK